MSIVRFPTKRYVALAVLLCLYFLAGSSFPQDTSSQEKTAADLKKEGTELYISGSYVKAIETFKQIMGITKEKAILSQAYLYISMSYYCLEEFEEAKKWLDLSLETVPEIESTGLIFPPGYDNFYKEAKAAKFGPEQKPGTETTVVRTGAARGGKKISPLLIIAGAVVVVGAVVLLLVLGGDDEKKDQPTTGTIQVNSNPTGAKVFLDGADTGKTTNCTLTDVAPGSHAVKVSKDGYVDFEGSANVTAGQTATVDATLAKNTITVTSPAASVTWTKGSAYEIHWTVGTSAATQGRVSVPSNMMLTPIDQQRLLLQRLGAARFLDRSRTPLAGRQAGEGPGLASARAGGRDGLRSGATGALSEQGQGLRQQAAPPLLGPGFVAPMPDQVLERSPKAGAGIGTGSSPMPLDIAKVKIDLYKGSSVAASVIGETENDGSHSYTVPASLANGSDYKVRVACSTDANVYGDSPSFTVSDKYVTVTSPTSSSAWDRGSTYTITWSSNLPAEDVKIELFKGGSLNRTIDSGTANDGSLSWTIPSTQTEGADYTIKVTAKTSGTAGTSATFVIAEATWTYDDSWSYFNVPSGITYLYSSAYGASRIAVTEKGANRIAYIKESDSSKTYSTVTLNGPTGLHDVSDGTHDDLLIADTGNNRVLRLSSSSTILYSKYLASSQPSGITSTGGSLYVVNKGLGNVQKLSTDLATVQGTYTVSGLPVEIAFNSVQNYFYLIDASTSSRRVLAYTTSFSPVSAGTWTLDYEPGGLACSSAGFIYVSDRTNKKVYKYSYNGKLVGSIAFSTSYTPSKLFCSGSQLYISLEYSTATQGRVYRYNW